MNTKDKIIIGIVIFAILLIIIYVAFYVIDSSNNNNANTTEPYSVSLPTGYNLLPSKRYGFTDDDDITKGYPASMPGGDFILSTVQKSNPQEGLYPGQDVGPEELSLIAQGGSG